LEVAGNAEAALVGAMLIDESAGLKVGKLTPEDFVNLKHRSVFSAIRALSDRGEPVDTITLEAELGRCGLLQAVGGIAGLNEYMLGASSPSNCAHYAAIIRDQAFARRLRLAASGAASRVGLGGDWRDALVTLRSALEDLETEAHVDAPTLREVATQELASIKRGGSEATGVSTGLGIERVCPTGIPLDKVTTVFGETGNFKTTVVSNLAWNAASAGHTVLCISWEDSNQLGAQRALARSSGVAYGSIAARKLEAADRLVLSALDPDIADRIIMEDGCEPNHEAVIRLARYYKRTRNLAAVVVDYIQLLDGRGTQKQVLDDAIQAFQRSAARDRIAYVLVSQVKSDVTNRKPEDGGPRPTLDDCLGSSAMRIGTKLGLGVFRPWKYCRVPMPKGAYGNYCALACKWPTGASDFLRDVYPRVLEISVSKNVMGEAPVVIPCLVDLPTGRIEPFTGTL
jgi:replicative DNA helicase